MDIINTLKKERKVSGIALDASELKALASSPQAMAKLGLGATASAAGTGMDAATGLLTSSNVGAPVQFLQNWLTGVVNVITAKRNGDELADLIVQGSWEDEQVVQAMLERTSEVGLYSDHGALPLVSWNPNYETRGVIRAQIGVEVTKLEDARANRAGINDANEKNAAAAEALEIFRNRVFFNGFNDGSNLVYGYLNDPNLPAYVTVPVGASTDTDWDTKTNHEIMTDVKTAMQTLRSQSKQRIDPYTDSITVAVASDKIDNLDAIDSNWYSGLTVRDWVTRTYPNVTIKPINELNEVNGGESVFYVYADKVDGSGTDGGQTIIQVVESKMMALNTVTTEKGTRTGYTNALSGAFVKRGFAVVRYSGI